MREQVVEQSDGRLDVGVAECGESAGQLLLTHQLG
jgi:hypothetical protein